MAVDQGPGATGSGPTGFRARLGGARSRGASSALNRDLSAFRASMQPSTMYFAGSEGLRPRGFDGIVGRTRVRMAFLVESQTVQVDAARGVFRGGGFMERMEASRVRDIAALEATINDAYDMLEGIGTENPGQQAKLEQAMGEVSALCTSAKNTVNGAYDRAIAGVRQAVGAVGSEIGHAAGAVAGGVEHAAEAVADDVKGAAQAVAHGVESIFHGW